MNNSKHLVICGDSFNIGIGCRNLMTEPYGQLLSAELDKPIINLAKGSSTNLSIYLQAKYAVDNLSTDLVIISHTSYDRVDWFPINYDFPNGLEIRLEDVNYHQYPPYGENSYRVDNKEIRLTHPLAANPHYKGTMMTENLVGIINYWETWRSKNKTIGYYDRINIEPTERIKLWYDYSKSLHEYRINRLQSAGLMTMAHQLLKKADIPHLILTDDIDFYSQFVESTNLCNINWNMLARKYPDDLPSEHTSPVGHRLAFNSILTKLKENNWV